MAEDSARRPARETRQKPAKQDDRPPIFERLAPFAPWDERSAPPLLDETQAAARAAEQAAAARSLAELATSAAGTAPTPIRSTLEHAAEILRFHSEVWTDRLGGRDGSAEGRLSQLIAAAGSIDDPLEGLAVLSRELLPAVLAEAVLLRAELGDELSPGPARWIGLVIDDLEELRAELELLVQVQLQPGDSERLARKCAEVARTVC
jgi:hypothetical protein